MNLHTLKVDVEALTDRPDLLHELLRSIVAEGLAQYHEWNELQPFQRLTVHFTTPAGERYKLVDFHQPEENEASEQLVLAI